MGMTWIDPTPDELCDLMCGFEEDDIVLTDTDETEV